MQRDDNWQQQQQEEEQRFEQEHLEMQARQLGGCKVFQGYAMQIESEQGE